MIIGLLISSSIFFICISYVFSNKNLMSPSLLLSFGYLVAIISCSMNIEKWNVDIHLNTCMIILLGIFSFFIGEFISVHILNKKKIEINNINLKCIEVSNLKIIIMIIINIVIALLLLSEIIRISGGFSGDFNEMMNKYKTSISYGDEVIKSYVVQLIKVAKGIGFVFLYIFFNNIFYDKSIKVNIKYLFPVFTYLIITFLKGGRLNMIGLVVASLFLYYYNWCKSTKWKKSISFKFIKILCITFIIFIIVFYQTKNIVGRMSKKNVFDYITEYLGGSIQLLDEYLNDNVKLEGKFETFPGVIQSINKLGFSNIEVRKSLEFRHIIDGAYLGNIYTGLRRYYNDFGYLGVIGLQIGYAILFNNIFIKIKRNNKITYANIYRTIFYSYNLFAILTQAMEDHFFIDLSAGYLIEMIIVYIMMKLIISKKYIVEERKYEFKEINS